MLTDTIAQLEAEKIKHCQCCNECFPVKYNFCPYCGDDLDEITAKEANATYAE